MNTEQWLFLGLVFLVVAGLAALAMFLFGAGALRQRIGAREETPGGKDEEDRWIERVARVVQPFTRLSLPEEGWERSELRTRFMNAGWRNASVPTLYFAAKTVLSLGLPAVSGALAAGLASRMPGQGFMFLLFGAATLGYYLPNGVLANIARRRQRDIFENLPDALDLLTVCVEAGLSMERALAKVAAEVHIKSMVLAQELQLVLMEMRAGFSKEKALRNLALRSGVEDVDTLVAMLVQAERFGTSMGDSLRVHAENLRLKRSQAAEEAASKVAVKLLFPLIFCIFPALMVVLMGPAGIQMSRIFLDQPH
ncbi:type II secretion system F family protein [Massilia sp. YIM B04103]|uniref:type II secretion system F family protein n=1 Tax=Massilia sp. YIM B04103 TaxID=2963106 RepID=UPI002108BB50|nr:type II secretion system F family protein [Massilia sp. YIM B04103]